MAKISFRKTKQEDIAYVAARLREADRRETIALGLRPELALELSAASSDFVWTGLIDDEPSLIFGCSQGVLSDCGEVWALGTDKCSRYPREMLLYGRRKLREMLEIYPVLENHCDARYEAALRWLPRIGFTVGKPEPYGMNNAPFCKISARRREV